MSEHTHNHDHKHSHEQDDGCGSCCVQPADLMPVPSEGRSFRVNGLDCAEEIKVLNDVVGPAVGGTENLAFDVLNGRMFILESATEISDSKIVKLVGSTGMSATTWDSDGAAAEQQAHFKKQKLFTGLSAGFWLGGLIFHVSETGGRGLLNLFSGHGGTAMPLPEVVLFLAAVVLGVWLVAPKAWSSARRLAPDMNLLMVIAVSGAIGLGEYFEAATVAFFFALSLSLESWSVGRARNAVSALLGLVPPTARVVYEDGSEADVPAAQVAIGSNFIVRGGDRIALDGEVVSGTGSVDQAPITGESAWIPKETGDDVYAGTINGEGTLTVRATKAASDTVLAKTIRMVGDAHSRRAQAEQWVTKFARIYTPIIMVLAILIALIPPLLFSGDWSFWFYNALVLLVIACPCALVISTPVSIVAALATSARNGVLIKGGAYVEAPARLSVLAMDKTGTITMGEPEVAKIHTIGKVSEAEVLGMAAALEMRSSHPIARAILRRAKADSVAFEAAGDTKTVPGRGVEGEVNGDGIWLGSDGFAAAKGLDGEIPAELRRAVEGSGHTSVIVGNSKRIFGVLEVRDTIRPDAKAVIARLHAQGVKRIVMLTGDNYVTAKSVADAVGIDEVHAELLPEDKVTAVEALIGDNEVVAMIGDGVNDAPAMARADFAIAMGAMGSDAAIETADIALMSDDISKVPWLIDHSRRTLGIIRQNIAIALATKALFVGLTAFGLASMWGAIAADVGVSLLVVANALRLLNSRDVGQKPDRPSGLATGLVRPVPVGG